MLGSNWYTNLHPYERALFATTSLCSQGKSESDDDLLAKKRFGGKLGRIIELVSDRRFYKPMILLLVLVVAIEWSSFPILGFYLVTIFKVNTIFITQNLFIGL